MAVTHALTTSDSVRLATIGATAIAYSFTGLERVDVTADSNDILLQYGDKTGGMDATKEMLVKSGMCRAIPKDPSKRGDEPWILTIVRRTADTVVEVTGHNEGVNRAF